MLAVAIKANSTSRNSGCVNTTSVPSHAPSSTLDMMVVSVGGSLDPVEMISAQLLQSTEQVFQ